MVVVVDIVTIGTMVVRIDWTTVATVLHFMIKGQKKPFRNICIYIEREVGRQIPVKKKNCFPKPDLAADLGRIFKREGKERRIEEEREREKHVIFVGAKSGRSISPIVPAGLNSCRVYQVATVLLSRQTAGLSGDSVCSLKAGPRNKVWRPSPHTPL